VKLYSDLKIKESLSLAVIWMKMNIMLNEISQIQKDKYHMSFICGIKPT
jgi:hypothetical protein